MIILNYLSSNHFKNIWSILVILINKFHVLIISIGIKILLLANNLNFSTFANFLNFIYAHLFSFFILTGASFHYAIDLGIIFLCYRTLYSISIISEFTFKI